MEELFVRFSDVLFEKTRLSALMILYREGSASFSKLKQVLKAADGSLYTHMERLVTHGYVQKKKEVVGFSAQTVYALTDVGSERLAEYLDFLEKLVQSGMTERREKK